MLIFVSVRKEKKQKYKKAASWWQLRVHDGYIKDFAVLASLLKFSIKIFHNKGKKKNLTRI